MIFPPKVTTSFNTTDKYSIPLTFMCLPHINIIMLNVAKSYLYFTIWLYWNLTLLILISNYNSVLNMVIVKYTTKIIQFYSILIYYLDMNNWKENYSCLDEENVPNKCTKRECLDRDHTQVQVVKIIIFLS